MYLAAFCAVSAALCLAVAHANPGSPQVLDSGRLKLGFSTAGGTLSLTEFADESGRNWACEPNAGDSLWKVAFTGPEGASAELSSAGVALSAHRASTDSLDFGWTASLGDGSARILMTIRCPEGDTLSRWSLKVDLPDGWRVSRCDFPVLPGIRAGKRAKLAAPAGWGLEYDVRPGLSYSGTYPSLVAAMQFTAFYGGGKGLYVGAHDPGANHKHFEVRADESRAVFNCINWPARSDTSGGEYEVPFEAVIGVFEGGYYEAAQIYRAFTFQTRWGSAGSVSKRRLPAWLMETQLWLMPAAEPVANVDSCVRAAEFFGVPIALHWYNWHEIPFDTLYPDYFPPKPRFAEGVRALQSAGMRVMPYVNGRLCDPNSKAWTEEGADEWAARQADGQPYTEVYGSNVPLNVMCPYTDYWQEKIAGIVDRLVNEFGVDGVYIDQIGAAAAVRCFAETHGHAPGGGSLWVDGYRKMLDQARKRLPDGAILTTEENTECWIDQFDALLLVNTATSEPQPIPLFPAVYSGRTVMFGFQYMAHDDLVRSLPFRAKMARAFAWGSQVGWVGVDRIMAPEAAKDAEFLRSLARCRRFGHDFLVCGRFLGMIDVHGDNPRMKIEGTGSFGGTYGIHTRPVIGSAWLSDDGQLGVALANLSDEDREVEVRLPLSQAGISPVGTLEVRTYGPEGLLGVDETTSAMRKMLVPARSALIAAVSAAARRR